jgi:hypothetical protein
MPLVVLGYPFSFLVDMPLIVCGVVVEKRHKGTIGDKRYDTIGFVGEELQRADPKKNNDKREPDRLFAEFSKAGNK